MREGGMRGSGMLRTLRPKVLRSEEKGFAPTVGSNLIFFASWHFLVYLFRFIIGVRQKNRIFVRPEPDRTARLCPPGRKAAQND